MAAGAQAQKGSVYSRRGYRPENPPSFHLFFTAAP